MIQCQCTTIKGDQCKLSSSKKLNDDSRFCWRHQNCLNIFSLEEQEDNEEKEDNDEEEDNEEEEDNAEQEDNEEEEQTEEEDNEEQEDNEEEEEQTEEDKEHDKDEEENKEEDNAEEEQYKEDKEEQTEEQEQTEEVKEHDKEEEENKENDNEQEEQTEEEQDGEDEDKEQNKEDDEEEQKDKDEEEQTEEEQDREDEDNEQNKEDDEEEQKDEEERKEDEEEKQEKGDEREEDKEYNWCKSPNIVKANIIENLERKDVENMCRTNKLCKENVCENRKFWKAMVKKQRNKDVPNRVNAMSFYYGMNLYAIGDTRKSKSFGLRYEIKDNVEKMYEKVIQVDKSRHYLVFINDNNDAFVSGTWTDYKLQQIPGKYIKAWIRDKSSGGSIKGVFVQDLQDNVYTASFSGNKPLHFLFKGKDIVVSDHMIYCDGKTYASQARGNFTWLKKNVVRQLDQGYDEIQWIYKKQVLPIRKFYENDRKNFVFVDTDNDLYHVIKRSIVLLDSNVDHVRITNYGLYWTKGHILFSYNKSMDNIAKDQINMFDMNSKIIKLTSDLSGDDTIAFQTENGDIFFYGKINSSFIDVYNVILPKNFNATNGWIDKPTKVASNVYDFAFAEKLYLIK